MHILQDKDYIILIMCNQSNAIILVKNGRSSFFFFFNKIIFILPKEPQPFKNKAAPHPGSSSNSILKISRLITG